MNIKLKIETDMLIYIILVKMPDYKNGKIYKIVCYDTDEVYIGSTVQDLEIRLNEHKKPTNGCCSKQIIDRNNYYIELLETYPCNNEFELNRKEGEYQRAIECINRRIAGRTDAEWRQDNKETIKAHGKKYYQDNKEKIKAYRQVNKAYKDRLVICECGIESIYRNLSRHKLSKRHIDLMNKLNLS